MINVYCARDHCSCFQESNHDSLVFSVTTLNKCYCAVVPPIIVLTVLPIEVAKGRCCAVSEATETSVLMFKDGKMMPCGGVMRL